MKPRRETVAVVGGGFTGAALAIHMVRRSPHPLDVRIVEPRANPGGGVAYSTTDPDHRMNGPIDILALFKDRPDDFLDWYRRSGELARDPDALASTGQLYCRRSTFGRYMGELVAGHAAGNASGSSIGHVRHAAVDVEVGAQGCTVTLDGAPSFTAARVHLAPGHERPDVPAAFAHLRADPGFVADPWASPDAVDPDGDVLILGTALTTADIVATLLRRGLKGRIHAISRRGLRPREQGVLPPAAERLARMLMSPPAFVRSHGTPQRAGEILRALRADIAEAAGRGQGWEQAFDDLRDAAPMLWKGLPAQERRKVLTRLRGFYDVHRFRMAPQIAEIAKAAERRGQLVFLRGRITDAERRDEGIVVHYRSSGGTEESLTVGTVINCTGPAAHLASSPNRLLRRLLERGIIRPDQTGVGIDVDEALHVVGRSGEAAANVRAFGTLTRGTFGDLIGIPQINNQILAQL